MITLSEASKQLKNSLIQNGVWFVLITLTNRDSSITMRIVNNSDDVTFGSDVFTAFPCQLDSVTESNKGEIPSVNLTLSNVSRVVEGYVEQDPDLGSGWGVHIDIVHEDSLTSGIAEVTYDFVTVGATADVYSVTFSCGIRNPIREQFPRIRMLPNSCQNTFKSGGCNYAGADTSCKKTLSDCRTKFAGASKIPFLGFPGIPGQDIYL